MKEYYILRDKKNRYYYSEIEYGGCIDKAVKIKSLDELITTIPIMNDSNWDFDVYKVSNKEITKVPEKIWRAKYKTWKEKYPEQYKKLYQIN